MSHHLFPWRETFLAALREYPVVQRACDVVGIERCTAYRKRQADPDFAREWDEAMEAGIDRAEQEAFRRAVEGTVEDVYHQGVVVGQKRNYSDALLAKVLAARRSSYRTSATEVSGPGGGPVQNAVIIATGVPRDTFDDLA